MSSQKFPYHPIEIVLAALPVTKAGLNSKSEAGDLDAQPERDKVTDLLATSFFYT